MNAHLSLFHPLYIHNGIKTWIYCSFSKLTKFWHHSRVFSYHKSKQRNYELTYMSNLIGHIIQNFEFCQPSALSYSTSPSLIPKWPSPGWIYWYFIIKHNLFLVCIFIEMLVTFTQWFWNMLWKIQCRF